jgi:hypothetical protein
VRASWPQSTTGGSAHQALRDPLIFTSLNQALVLRGGKRTSFWADLSDRLAKRRQDNGRPRRKRPAAPQVAAAQPIVSPAKMRGCLSCNRAPIFATVPRRRSPLVSCRLPALPTGDVGAGRRPCVPPWAGSPFKSQVSPRSGIREPEQSSGPRSRIARTGHDGTRIFTYLSLRRHRCLQTPPGRPRPAHQCSPFVLARC